ncbi:MAG: carbohydrate porin [Rhodospirillales bacterium]|nr:carbohydrate porin [Rhodospirillales bacterium]
MRRALLATALLGGGLIAAVPTAAQTAPADPPRVGLWERDALLGDLGGVRPALAAWGLTFGLSETSEVLGNVSGGLRRGAVYEGATLMSVTLDTGQRLGIPDGTFMVSAYQIHGHGLSTDNIGNLNVASGIEGPRSTRLFELWYEQALLDGQLAIRVGQQAADSEFAVAGHAGVFINAGFGWPTLSAADLPGGGPAYPTATPGVRVKWQATDQVAALLGVYNGDPADNGDGTAFRLNKGVFVIGELQYARPKEAGLPGTYKIGAWYNSNAFADQRYGADGLSLANPASIGTPLSHRNNWSVYAVLDQMLYRAPGSEDGGLAVFARIAGAPGDRNAVDLFLNAGLTYKGLVPGRADDTAGIGVVYARVSRRAAGLDSDTGFYSGGWYPVRGSETAVELTYQAQVAPWWVVQPDLQYVFNPGGGLPDPNRPGRRIGGAAILGLRTVVTF